MSVIFPSKYVVLKKLQDGTYTVVQHIRFNNGKRGVMKKLEPKLDPTGKHLSWVKDCMEREYDVTDKLSHRNIMPPLGISEYSDFVIYDDFVGIDLLDLLNKRRNSTLMYDRLEFLKLLRQVISGLEYLHSAKVSHMDIKLENIIVNNGRVKIIDFGHSYREELPQSGVILGTHGYYPPETLLKTHRMPYKADIWSFGIMLYLVLFDKVPWNDADHFKDVSYALFRMHLQKYFTLPETMFNTNSLLTYLGNDRDVIIIKDIFLLCLEHNMYLRGNIHLLTWKFDSLYIPLMY